MPKTIDNKNDALKFAMKLIGLRRRSEAEIRERLGEKGCDETLTEETVSELYKFSYLDDAAFAESYINDRIRFRPAGSFLIKMELQKKGIAHDIIEEKLSELLSAKDELSLARKLLEKKMRTSPAVDGDKARAKLAFYLRSRGFSPQIINEAIQDILRTDKTTIHEDE
jgi:regulatory protein